MYSKQISRLWVSLFILLFTLGDEHIPICGTRSNGLNENCNFLLRPRERGKEYFTEEASAKERKALNMRISFEMEETS